MKDNKENYTKSQKKMVALLSQFLRRDAIEDPFISH